MNRKLVGSAVVGAAALAIVVAQFAGGEDASKAAPPPTATMPTATTLPYQQSFEVYRFPPAEGDQGWPMQIPVPTGWTETHDANRATYRSGEFVLETDRAPLGQRDPMLALASAEQTTRRPGYRLHAVATHPPVGGYPAAKWEYSYQRDGSTRQVREIWIAVRDAMITIRYDAPESQFVEHVKVIDDALKISGPR
jgi:hypothetical protein